MMKFDFKNEAEKASLKIYDYIGNDGWEEGVTAQAIEDELNEAGNKALDIYINSNGGDVFEGFAIYNILSRYNGYKTVYIDGIAASIASVIAMCGNKIIMNTASMMMIHNASGACWGNAEDMKKVVQALESINEVIRDVYKTRTNLDDNKLAELMDNETFMTAKECVDYGFADEIGQTGLSSENMQNCIKSIEELTNNYDKKIKAFKDMKNIGFDIESQGDSDPVVDEEKISNKLSHWDWLRNGGKK